ncbi:MAG: hypothetical protein HY884_09325 [Deltaproteobacteria bacterium]|nr:hypothetical protein [Deltaproteobacteria bacterium]
MKHQKVKRFLVFLAIFFFTLAASPAFAGEFGDLKAKINAAREATVLMLKNKDKRGANEQKAITDTANAVSAMLSKMKAPAGKDAKFKDLVDTWNAFKKTRSDELIPMILAGKQEDADKLAGGIQKERFGKMMGIVDELGK